MRRLATFTTGLALVAFAALIGAVPAAASSVLEVPVAFPTIQSAIDAAANGDTVLVDPGTYFENIDFKGKLITVRSAQGPSVTTIDGGNVAPVVNFSHSETTAAVLQGFTIQHGNGNASFQYMGGGVRISFASPTLIGNIITANVACSGGAGVSAYFSSPLIQDNTINGNSTLGCSGGQGGGINLQGAASAQIIHNVITNNASDWGAGISLFAAGTPTLLNNTISNNNARMEGGAVYAVNQSDANIVQNIVIGNSAPSGGGFYISPPQGTRGALVVSNTIIGNTANDSGVLLNGFVSSVQLTNNIVVSYTAQPAILCQVAPILDHNDFFNPSAASDQGACAPAIGSNGNFSADPQFASNNDAHLKSTSPAVDAGNNSAPSLPATDLDGNPRICGTAVDIGAYELQRPLAFTSGSGVSAVEGVSSSMTLGHFVGGYAPFAATVDWGDGQTSAATITGGDVSGAHIYAEEGADAVAITLSDSTGTTSSGNVAATVSDAPISGTGKQLLITTEANPFTGPVATFQDTDPGGVITDYTATIDWGDGTTSPASLVNGPNYVQASGAHTYAEEGNYNVTTTLTDAGGASASAVSPMNVGDAALSGSGIAASAVENSTFTANLATFTDSDPNGTLSDYSAVIAWGDGTSSAGTVSPNGQGGYVVSGSHVYFEEGTYTVSVTADDAQAAAIIGTVVTVSDAPLVASAGAPITASEGSSVTAVVATFNDPAPSGTSWTASIDWGDHTTSVGTVATGASGGFTVTGSHTYAEEGTYTVTVTITDDGGATTNTTTTATISDAAITATGTQFSVHHKTNFTATVATLSDADPGAAASDYAGTITWGDGSTTSCPSSGCTIVRLSNGTFSVSASHSYSRNGKYTVTIQLKDGGGAATKATTTITAT